VSQDQKTGGAHQTSVQAPIHNPNGTIVVTTAPVEKEMPDDVEITGVLIPATRYVFGLRVCGVVCDV
jgi:hypothetical protein